MKTFRAAFTLIAAAIALNIAFALITSFQVSNEVRFLLWITALATIITVAARAAAKFLDF